MKNKKRTAFALFILIALVCVTISYCAWSGHYFNDDLASGLVGGIIGCAIAVISGCIFAKSINNYK